MTGLMTASAQQKQNQFFFQKNEFASTLKAEGVLTVLMFLNALGERVLVQKRAPLTPPQTNDKHCYNLPFEIFTMQERLQCSILCHVQLRDIN